MNIAVEKDEKDFHCVTENSFFFFFLGTFLFVLFLRNKHCGYFAV